MYWNTSMHTLIRGSTEDRDYLDDKIIQFNSMQVPFTQTENFINIDYVFKDGDKTIAGITAILYCWKCLYINVIWVDDKFRHQGLGTQLIERVEKEAKELGCTLIHLDTFDFQAKEFYLKRGYNIFGELDDCPPGHKRFFFKKAL